jgi:hypothetical protein
MCTCKCTCILTYILYCEYVSYQNLIELIYFLPLRKPSPWKSGTQRKKYSAGMEGLEFTDKQVGTSKRQEANDEV